MNCARRATRSDRVKNAYFMPPIRQMLFHSASVTGWTDNRELLTSTISFRRGSARTAASGTGFGIGATALTSTATQGSPALAVEIRMVLADDLDDADDLPGIAGVKEEGSIALLHFCQIVLGLVVAYAGPGFALGALGRLLIPRPGIRLRLHQPISHRGYSLSSPHIKTT